MATCTIIKLKTVDQRLTVVQQPVLASGDVGTVRVEYVLDSYWDGYIPSGTFYAGKQPEDVYEQPLTDGACVIPWEVLQEDGVLYIGLRGVDAAGLVKTAAPVRYRVEKGSPGGSDTSREPTPDVYQTILTMVAQSAESAAESAEDATAAENAAQGAAASAAAAETAATGAAASATAAENAATNAASVAQSVRNDADAGAFDGLTPFIGDDGNWWIGDFNTGIFAGSAYDKEELDAFFADKLSLSGGTMIGMINMLKGDSNAGIMNGEGKKIFGYGTDSNFYTGDPEYPLKFRGSKANPTYNALDMLKVQTGSYTGTGKAGSENKNSITFSFEPKIVYVYESSTGGKGIPKHMLALRNIARGASTYSNDYNGSTVYGEALILTWEGNTLSWYCYGGSASSYATNQLTASGATYYYIAIG